MFAFSLSILLLAGSLALFFRNHRSILPSVFFFQSFWGLNLFGVALNDLALILGVAYIFFASFKVRIPRRVIVVIAALIFCVALPSVWGHQYLLSLPKYDYAIAQVPAIRSVLVLIERILILLLVLLPFAVSRSSTSSAFEMAIKGYVAGVGVQASLGLYQVTAELTSLPVWGYAMGDKQYVGGVVRLNAFAGEPRHFAVFCSIALAFLVARNLLRATPIFGKRADLIVMLTLALALLFTFSTTGFALMSLMLLVLFVMSAITSSQKNRKLLVMLLGLPPVLFFGLANNEIVDTRLIQRVGIDYYATSEYSSYSVVELLRDKPHLGLLGVGPGLPAYFLKEMPAYTEAYTRNSNLRPEVVRDPNGFFLLVLELGLLGGVLPIFALCVLRRSRGDKISPEERSHRLFCIFVFITGVISLGPLSPLFSAGIGCYLADRKNEKLVPRLGVGHHGCT